jgi:hypothetical protein
MMYYYTKKNQSFIYVGFLLENKKILGKMIIIGSPYRTNYPIDDRSCFSYNHNRS